MALLTTETLKKNAIAVYNSLLFESDLNLYQTTNYQPKNQMSYTQTLSPDQQLMTGIEIWKYVIEEILHFDPETALAYIDDGLIKRLRLDKTVFLFGCGLRDRTRPGYAFVLQFIYPNEIKYAEDRHMKDLCEYAKRTQTPLAKSYFWSQEEYNERCEKRRQVARASGKKFNDAYNNRQIYRGRENAVMCMKQIVYGHFFGNNTTEEIYQFFANERRAHEIIDQYGKIYGHVIPKYFPTALDYLHESLQSQDRSDFWYTTMKLRKRFDKLVENKNVDLSL